MQPQAPIVIRISKPVAYSGTGRFGDVSIMKTTRDDGSPACFVQKKFDQPKYKNLVAQTDIFFKEIPSPEYFSNVIGTPFDRFSAVDSSELQPVLNEAIYDVAESEHYIIDDTINKLLCEIYVAAGITEDSIPVYNVVKMFSGPFGAYDLCRQIDLFIGDEPPSEYCKRLIANEFFDVDVSSYSLEWITNLLWR